MWPLSRVLSRRHLRQQRRYARGSIEDISAQRFRHTRSQFRPSLRPIYIYPGLKRNFREIAIVLDQQVPASVYRCSKCDEEKVQELANDWKNCDCEEMNHVDCKDRTITRKSGKEMDEEKVCEADLTSVPSVLRGAVGFATPCSHDKEQCAICLESFHSKDLIRTLPCLTNGCPSIFHSRCILTWLGSRKRYRCPLCNNHLAQESASTIVQTPSKHRMEIYRRQQVPLQLMSTENRQGGRFNPYLSGMRVRDILQMRDDDASAPSTRRIRRAVRSRGGKKETMEDADSGVDQQRGEQVQSYSYIIHDPIRFEVVA